MPTPFSLLPHLRRSSAAQRPRGARHRRDRRFGCRRALALAALLLALPTLAGCSLFESPGLSSIAGTAGSYASTIGFPGELRVELSEAGILGGSGAIDSQGTFAIDLEANLSGSVLPRVTEIGIGGADLFGVSVSDRGARVALGEIGVLVSGIDVGFLLLGNIDASTPINADGVVLAQLVYADRAVSLEGTARSDDASVRYGATIPRGWSFLTIRRGAGGDGPIPYTVTSAPVGGLSWFFDQD